MAGKSINGVNHMCLMEPNSLKFKSLEDNLYFTLRDIFWNTTDEYALQAHHLYNLLSNNVRLEDRTIEFKYVDVLNESDGKYIEDVFCFFQDCLEGNLFVFDGDNYWSNNDHNHAEYMPFSEWRGQLSKLINLLNVKYNQVRDPEEN